MNTKLIHSIVLAGFLGGSCGSAVAQTVCTAAQGLCAGTASTATTVISPDAGVVQAGGQGLGFQFVSGEPGISMQIVKGVPFSLEATIQSVQTLSDGNRIVHSQTLHLYRDSKGRTRREETLAAIGPWAASGTPPTMITIQDPVSRVSYFLNPQQKIAIKLPSAPAGKGVMVTGRPVGGTASASVSSAPVGNSFVSAGEDQPVILGFNTGSPSQSQRLEEKRESLGKEAIAGLSADGTRITITIPSNAMGNERPLDIIRDRWYSPDLQIVLRSKQSDPRFGQTTYEVTSLDREEPAPSLFEVPSDYKISEGEAPSTRHADSK
jgi:hypothetical protein